MATEDDDSGAADATAETREGPPAILEPDLLFNQLDEHLVEYLRETGFAGPEYERFEWELVGSALSRVKTWIQTGEAFIRMRRNNISLYPSPAQRRLLARDRHEAKSLAHLAIAMTLPRFRNDALIEHGWQPDMGASLITYFCNAVIQSLPNAFREWVRTQPGATDLISLHDSHGVSDPELEQFEVEALLRGLGYPDEKIAIMVMGGFTHVEIAAELGLKPRVVGRRLEKIRKSLGRALKPRVDGRD